MRKDVDSLILRGEILNAQGHPDQAVHSLEAAIKSDSQNPAAHYGLGVTLIAIGDTRRATSELQAAARLRPSMTQVYRTLGALALRKQDTDLLRQSGENWIAAQPYIPDGYLMRGIATGATGNYAAAETDIQEAISVAPEDSRGYAALGQLRMAQKKNEEAHKLFEQALVKNPRDLQAMTGVVQIYVAQKEQARAAERIAQQIAKVPGDSGLYGLQGEVRMAMKDFVGAEQAFTKAVDLNPNSVDAILALTRAQLSRGSADQAVASYQLAIQKDPRDVRPYILLGSLEESKGKWSDAQQHYQRALQVQPDNPAAANNLAYLLLNHGGNSDVALSLAQTARRGLPDLANTADTLAWAYINKGAFGFAVDLLQEATNASPANPTYHYHLGLAYQKSNDTAHAKAQFERALQ